MRLTPRGKLVLDCLLAAVFAVLLLAIGAWSLKVIETCQHSGPSLEDIMTASIYESVVVDLGYSPLPTETDTPPITLVGTLTGDSQEIPCL